MNKLFLLLAVPAVILLFSCNPTGTDEPEKPVEYDIEFSAQKIEALAIPPETAGFLLEIETDCHVMALNMSDNGFDELGLELPNSTYFVVSFLYEVPDGGDEIKVADGVYEYVAGKLEAGNIVLEMCYYTRTGSAVNDWEVEYVEDLSFTDAVLTVTTEGGQQTFDFAATLEDGRTAHAVYRGDVSFDEIAFNPDDF